jgi:hypothetical protein
MNGSPECDLGIPNGDYLPSQKATVPAYRWLTVGRLRAHTRKFVPF